MLKLYFKQLKGFMKLVQDILATGILQVIILLPVAIK